MARTIYTVVSFEATRFGLDQPWLPVPTEHFEHFSRLSHEVDAVK